MLDRPRQNCVIRNAAQTTLVIALPKAFVMCVYPQTLSFVSGNCEVWEPGIIAFAVSHGSESLRGIISCYYFILDQFFWSFICWLFGLSSSCILSYTYQQLYIEPQWVQRHVVAGYKLGHKSQAWYRKRQITPWYRKRGMIVLKRSTICSGEVLETVRGRYNRRVGISKDFLEEWTHRTLKG